MSGAQPLSFVPTLPPEEAARANVYGLVARLFYAPPDEQLIAELVLAAESDRGGEQTAEQSMLADAWRSMVEACRTASAAELKEVLRRVEAIDALAAARRARLID